MKKIFCIDSLAETIKIRRTCTWLIRSSGTIVHDSKFGIRVNDTRLKRLVTLSNNATTYRNGLSRASGGRFISEGKCPIESPLKYLQAPSFVFSTPASSKVESL